MQQRGGGAAHSVVFIALMSVAVWLEGCGSTGQVLPDDQRPVLVTGATGRTGILIYGFLKGAGLPVRAFVRSASKARDKLNCSTCNESDGIFVGDITQPESLSRAVAGSGALVIATSAEPVCTYPEGGPPNCTYAEGGFPFDVDWVGANAQLSAFANATAPALDGPVVLISTEGTTNPVESLPGNIGFYKLNFEATLMASGLPFVIVKPCGLIDSAPREAELLVGHDDSLVDIDPPLIPRSDVARVAVAGLQRSLFTKDMRLRFDLCSQEPATGGHATTDMDLPNLLDEAHYHWGQSSLSREARIGEVNI